jgi:hypothetical protein
MFASSCERSAKHLTVLRPTESAVFNYWTTDRIQTSGDSKCHTSPSSEPSGTLLDVCTEFRVSKTHAELPDFCVVTDHPEVKTNGTEKRAMCTPVPTHTNCMRAIKSTLLLDKRQV